MQKLLQIITLFIMRHTVITEQDAKNYGLKWYCNLYGDSINQYNCRSFWLDNKGREYRVKTTFFHFQQPNNHATTQTRPQGAQESRT